MGEDAIPLFVWMGDARSFRRRVAKVTKLRPNELRGANIDDMKLRAAESKLHPVQFFAGKTKEIQAKHYTASAGEGLALLQANISCELGE